MKLSRLIPLITVVSAILLAWLVAGCGGQESSETSRTTEGLPASRPVDLLLTDCSGSFRDGLAEHTATFKVVVDDSAARGRELWHGCFDGSPLRTLRWRPKVSFGVLPNQVKQNGKLAERFTAARAAGTVNAIEQEIKASRQLVAGSGQLEALEVAARTPGVGRIFMVTDLITFEADGLTLRTADQRQIKQAVARWLPRLGQGLRGVQVFIVGYGRHAPSSKAARNADRLFTDLIIKAKGRVLVTKDLPFQLVIEGGHR